VSALWLAVLGALAGEHDGVAPATVEAVLLEVPLGEPRQIRVAPGADLAAAIRPLPPGSRVVLGTGEHRGPLVVDRALEVWGEPGAVITGGGRGSVVVIAAADVTVRDVRITGGGHLPQDDDAGLVVQGDRFRIERVDVDHVYLGIDLRRSSDGVVRGCHVVGDPSQPFGLRGDGIRLWEAHHNQIRDNVLEDVRDLVVWYSDDNRIAGNVVTGSRYGTHLMHTTGNLVSENRYRDDVVGVFTMYSSEITLAGNTVSGSLGAAGVGFGFKESDAIVVEDNQLVANTTGLYLDSTPHRIGGVARFSGNLIAANEVGLRLHGSQAGAVFDRNGFVGNVAPVSVDGGGDAVESRFSGNTWTEYAGYDLDADGVGDLPFELRSASGQLRDRRPDLAFFTGTPAAALLDLFASAFPMFAPRPLVRDERPVLWWEAP
jgi:nitrous oxidase accessory protein